MPDLAWFRTHLLDEILPNWLAAVTEQGLFLPHFDRAWQPMARNSGTLVSQGRLLYNFSQGYALTRDLAYLDAVRGGAAFLLRHFRDPTHGGWYWSCSLDGDVLEPRKDSYGHAFILLGLAHAYRCTGDRALQEAMIHTWEVLAQHFRDEQGGFRWRMTQEFAEAEHVKSQNPVMHIFEALLAAGTVGGAPQMLDHARQVGDFVLTKLVRTADRRLPEVYDTGWHELPAQSTESGERGGRLDIGHAFEWAYLTAHAAELGFPAHYLDYGNSFIAYGLALGFDWQAGGIYSPASPTGQISVQHKGWWEQCETIRALLHYVIRYRRSDLLEPLQKTLAFVQRDLIDPDFGGWYQAAGPNLPPKTREKGHEWKLDYHIVGMCMEAIRLAEQAPAP